MSTTHGDNVFGGTGDRGRENESPCTVGVGEPGKDEEQDQGGDQPRLATRRHPHDGGAEVCHGGTDDHENGQ